MLQVLKAKFATWNGPCGKLLNISAPPLSMRLPRDVLLPHCTPTQLTIALDLQFKLSCNFSGFSKLKKLSEWTATSQRGSATFLS